MGLIEEMVESVRAAHESAPLVVVNVVVGPRFTAIAASKTADGSELTAGGIAHNNASEVEGFDGGRETARAESALRGRPLHEVAAFLAHSGAQFGALSARGWDTRPIETRVDLGAAALNAALNALVQSGKGGGAYRVGDENGVALIEAAAAGKKLVMVGRLPYTDRIKAAAGQAWVLELEPQDDDLPMSAAAEVLPGADVVGVVGTALLDGVLEQALSYVRPDAYVVQVGPSTPLSAVLFGYGVNALSGSVVADPARVLEQLRMAHEGPTPRLDGMRPVTLHPRSGR
jgi:hypothetical protein